MRQASAAVIVVALGQAILRANYARFKAIEGRVQIAESTALSRQAHSARQTALGNMVGHFLEIMNEALHKRPSPGELQNRLDDTAMRVVALLRQHFDGGEAALFAGTGLPVPDVNAIALSAEGQHQYAQIYMIAEQRSLRLQRLIESARRPHHG